MIFPAVANETYTLNQIRGFKTVLSRLSVVSVYMLVGVFFDYIVLVCSNVSIMTLSTLQIREISN